MRIVSAIFILFASTFAASAQEAGVETNWRLIQMNGADVAAVITLTFLAEPSSVAGSSSCNRYVGSYAGTFPDISFPALAGTRMACEDMSAEDAYLAALNTVAKAAIVTGTDGALDQLVLSSADGPVLVYYRSAQ